MNRTLLVVPISNPECQPSEDEINQTYDLILHIISVFILFIVSLISASIAVITTRVRALRINPIIINTGKFFGSGIVLATGFIHMLPAAMEALTDPCLPEAWKKYDAFAGLFAMLAVLAMQLIEFIAHERFQSSPYPRTSTDIEEADKHSSETNIQITVNKRSSVQITACDHTGHQHGLSFQNEAQRHKISTYLLEFGIALHSVLIGVALGVTTDTFIVLLVALSFHQFFEGMALGAQIARVERMSLCSAVTMVLSFALTTPVGIAIGIGIHFGAYNPKSVVSLLINGILDSVSAGILIYVALVNLINAEMGVSARAFHLLKVRLKIWYFFALYAGAAVMGGLGRWT